MNLFTHDPLMQEPVEEKIKSSQLQMDTSLIHRYVWMGRKDQDWYQDCEKVFRDIFGDDELQLVTRLFAGTSITTALKANITLFRRAYAEIKQNKPMSSYLPNIELQIRRIREGKDLSGRKINSFANAMAGDPHAVVVDIWLMRAFGMGSKTTVKSGRNEGRLRNNSPSNRQYTLVENWVRQEAAVMGLQARELSAMIWSGVRISQGGDRQTRYTSLLRQKLANPMGL